MKDKLTSEKQIIINADAEKLWSVLTQSKYTKDYMFNCSVNSDWKKGSSIIWQGNYEGYEAYQKGEILEIERCKQIKYSTFDPNYGYEDKPENYIHVTYLLKELNDSTELTIINETFDGNKERMDHIEQGWDMVMSKIREITEKL